MIQVTNLTKRYDSTVALNGLSLTVPKAAIFCLLGPNGSGKSTLIKLIMGFIFPDGGEVLNVPPHIGYLPERIFFPSGSRIAEYLRTIGQLGGLTGKPLHEQVATTLQQVGLSEAAQWRIKACSKGMLQRLGLAQALLTDPPLLILDEPMGGLDPSWQHQLRNLIRKEHQKGKTILLSTHRLSDIAELCTHVGILSRGRLMRTGTLEEVLPVRPQLIITVSELPPALHSALRKRYPNIAIDHHHLTLNDDAILYKNEVLHLLMDGGVDIQQVEQQRATLEEIYLEVLRS